MERFFLSVAAEHIPHLTEGEVCSVLRTLDVDKATGPDKIPAVSLKNCAASPSLCELFNKSLSCGKLPREWKLSNISPIPKKNPSHEVSNYRPKSLLSLVSKVFERCIYNRIIDHLSNQLYSLQYGFQSGKSTTSQMLYVLHEIHEISKTPKFCNKTWIRLPTGVMTGGWI
jgi:hypothetical protein